jgi:hypothetical protein
MVVKQCSLMEFYRRFGGRNCLHLQGQKVSQASNKQEASSSDMEVLHSSKT